MLTQNYEKIPNVKYINSKLGENFQMWNMLTQNLEKNSKF